MKRVFGKKSVTVLVLVVVLFATIIIYSASASAVTTITETSSVTGSLSVLGALSKGSGTFVIDHPLDPKNKLLYHSFVESPDVKNIYDGVATLDSSGVASIELPRYFFALNKDFRYLVTPLTNPMPNLYLKDDVRAAWFGMGKPVFKIAGGTPGGEISWQITGIRHDPYIQAYPMANELEKGPDALVNAGECLFKPLCN